MDRTRRLAPTALSAIVAILTAALVGCGQSGNASPEPSPSPSADLPWGEHNYIMRGGLGRSLEVFESGGTARVAFLGGSVTTFDWTEEVADYLEARFPDTEFEFVNAGLGGTPAELGAFRLEEDVFGDGPVDLMFLEFAVNTGSVEAMEGIVRHARELNPDIDIVQIHIAASWFSDSIEDGLAPWPVPDHERVAEHYRNPSLHLYKEVFDDIAQGLYTWEDFSPDGVHPTELGIRVYADFVTGFLEDAWAVSGDASPYGPLPEPLTAKPWDSCSLLPFDSATSSSDFTAITDWHPRDWGNIPEPIDFYQGSGPGAEIRFDFKGTMVGLYTVVGPDSGVVDYRIDDGEWVTLDTAHDSWYPDDSADSNPNYRLNYFLLDTSLPGGDHTIVFRVPDEQDGVVRFYRLMVG